jgi:hypothetical protein
VTRTPSGHARKHACPHGSVCEPGFRARLGGKKDARCGLCAAARVRRNQLDLFHAPAPRESSTFRAFEEAEREAQRKERRGA